MAMMFNGGFSPAVQGGVDRATRRPLFGAPFEVDTRGPPIVPQQPTYPDQQSTKPLSTGRMIAGSIGDSLLQWAGARPVFAPMMAERQQQAAQLAAEQRQRAASFADWRAREDYQATQPRYFTSAGGDIVKLDPATGASSLAYDAPARPIEPTALQQNFEWYSRLSPEQQKTARPMMSGYAYTPEGISATVGRAGAVANAQGAARAAYRAPPKAGSGGGGDGQFEYKVGPGGKLLRRRKN